MSDDEFKRAMEAQRRAFEAQFGSLEEMGFEDKTRMSESDDSDNDMDEAEEEEEDEFDYEKVGKRYEAMDDDSDDSDVSNGEEKDEEEDFQGFQDAKEEAVVIKFQDSVRDYKLPSKQELKLLKSGKAAPTKPKVIPVQKKSGKSNKENEENLANDLELQRFLDESHILANFQEQNSGVDLTLQTMNSNEHGHGIIGNARRHTLDSRLKQISNVNSTKTDRLEKMPISMRKGMIKSRLEKISKFEQDAKDGGIILSKVKKGEFRKIGGSLTIDERIGVGIKSQLDQKGRQFRAKGLKINSIGKSTRNGLVISQRDIDRINGPVGGKGKKGKKGRR